jgi:outer membrane protein TolC
MRIVRYPPPRRQRESEGGLAQARYRNGISSIVEFNQAQLNLLSAQIAYTDTQYEYLLQRSALNYQTGSLH